MKRRLAPVTVAAALALGALGAAWSQPATVPASAPAPLVLGVVPQFPAIELQRRWGPVQTWLESECQVRIRLDIASSIPAFEERFLQGHHDLAYLNPYHAVMAKRAQGYEPLVRDGKEMLTGVLVVRADSAVRRLQDLQGATLAFPAPNAFGASLYMRALLEREHGLRFTASYVKTHANAYRHVLRGDAAAAGGIQATLDAEGPEVRDQLRVLYETPPAAPHPLAAHPRVRPEVRRCITERMTRAGQTEAVRDWLAGIQMPQPVVAQYERDYRPLEKLSLESYVVRTAP
ncbi:phosphate/phosphite/phosphonate ABC transporter substrate-binding protein [Hydrogenophaga sp.]|uniref:phosphate/phosphite/phosphonate ABC transporter substrate-binding protein n=1 Tax=Hydrogenophaga sp. TaxID=1904254 RepID=UPI00286E564D|nr:phosphate/phosphite/phosphonate ABC transporter substrate-binding protein [Hydrogenophaga sp.]